MFGYIYITTNLVNKKSYIGKHKAKVFDKNYLGSGVNLVKAVNKYGKDKFKCRMLEPCNSLKELNKKERYYIEKYNAIKNKNYYNVSRGGDGGDTYSCLSEKELKRIRKKLSKSIKLYLSEHPDARKGQNNPCYGKTSKFKGVKNRFKHSEKTKRHLSQIRKNRVSPFKGHHHTKETREKMSKTRRHKEV